MKIRGSLVRVGCACALVGGSLLLGACAQNPSPSASSATYNPRITPHFIEADITAVARAVASVTGKNIVLEPSVRDSFTYSADLITPEEFYADFVHLLDDRGFEVVDRGDVVIIRPR